MKEKFKILVVDDYFAIRRNFKIYLERFNCEVIETGNGKEALSVLNEKGPEQIDVIIVDLIMPGMNGAEFIIKSRNKFGEKLPPVLVCSSKSKLEIVRKVVALGINGYLLKPVDFNELNKNLKNAVPDLPLELKRSC